MIESEQSMVCSREIPSLSSFQSQPSNTPNCHPSIPNSYTDEASNSTGRSNELPIRDTTEISRRFELVQLVTKNTKLIIKKIPSWLKEGLICKPKITILEQDFSFLKFDSKMIGIVRNETEFEISLEIESLQSSNPIDQNEIPNILKNNITIDFERFLCAIVDFGVAYSNKRKSKWEEDGKDESIISLTSAQKEIHTLIKQAVLYWILYIYNFKEEIELNKYIVVPFIDAMKEGLIDE